MARLGGTKFTWVIKNVSSLQSTTYHSSDTFKIGITGYTCHLSADPDSSSHEGLSVYITFGQSIPPEQRRYVIYSLTIVNQLWVNQFIYGEGVQLFYPWTKEFDSVSVFFLPPPDDTDAGFFENDEVKIVVEFSVYEYAFLSGISEGFNKTIRPLRKIEEKSGSAPSLLLKEASESVDVNGFQVFPSQVEYVRRMFERHPDIAVGFRAKNQHLRSTCMNFLLSLIETLCQLLEDISNEDLVEADIALTYLKDAGFEVEWLKKKLDHVKVKKEKVLTCLVMLQETEENLLKQKQKCAELEALAEEQKKVLSVTKTSLSFDDVV